MFSLRIDQVKIGMTLAKPVFNMNGTKLLEKDFTLDDKLIKSLKNAGAVRIWVTDDSSSLLKEMGPQRIYNEIVRELEEAREKVIKGQSFDIQNINEAAYELTEQIILNETPYAEMVRMKLKENSILEHMLDVSILAIVTGKALGMDKLDLRFLGFSSLVHDIGKLLIPAEIWSKPAKLNNTEMRQVQKHPQIGFDILNGIDGINKYALQVTLQHHERLDGSGYPYGIKGGQIHCYSRVVAIADIYTAVIREKAYRPRLPIYEAGELLWAEAGAKLDKKLASVFLRHVVAFPLRCTIRLNNGRVGQVVYQNGDFPTRPIVCVDGEMIDLAENTTLFVAEVLAYETDQG